MRAYVPLYLAVNYILFATVAAVGVLQAVAMVRGDGRWAAFVSPDRPRAGYAVAIAGVVGAFAAYWSWAPELLMPGPAGAELTALFGLSALMALGIARGLARWRESISSARPPGGALSQDRRDFCFSAPRQSIPLRGRLAWLVCLALSTLVGLYDLPLFRVLNGLAGRSVVLDAAFQFFMNDHIVPTALALALLGLWFVGRTPAERAANQSLVLRALLALALAGLLLSLVNLAYFRPRPFADREVTLLFYHPSDSSFPSNAAAVGFSLAVAVGLGRKPWGAGMLALAGAMAVARVCGGVHFPLDVVAGAWLGGLAAWTVNRAAFLDRALAGAVELARRMGLA